MSRRIEQPQQTAVIRLVNWVGERLLRAGIEKPAVDAQVLLRHAQRKTGLEGFGDDSFMPGLEILCASLRSEAQLSQVGRIAAYYNLLDQLCVRQRLLAARLQRPEVSAQGIRRPLIITGLPRTGTTILFELLAQDPNLRSPASWEVAKPEPPATEARYFKDSRIRTVDRMMALMEVLAPGFRAIHSIAAGLPQECVYLLASHFTSEQFSYMYDIPAYRAWALEQDMSAAYAWHEFFLQHMQADFAREGWLLKSPAHLAHLSDLLAQYPDAQIVWTHRQPIDAISSFSSLASTLRSGFSDAVDPVSVGRQEFEYFSKVLQRGMEQRDELDQGQFADISFSAICSDPIAAIEAIYTQFDRELSAEAESRMRQYLQQHPRGLYGEHAYSPAGFGLDSVDVAALYEPYLERYQDYLAK